MKKGFECKSVVIVGASGGLGSSFVKTFANQGARLLLAGRSEEKLKAVANQLTGDLTITTVDITKEVSVSKLAEFAKQWSDKIDIVVNASGYDVRKSLEDYTYEEIRNTLDINVLGTILLTKAFLPFMKNNEESMIVHIGGFADGRMAFPYYSVDVASRAGMFTFIESINRELKLESNKTKVSFFCPSPAETDAERPFHPLWRKMGIKILPVENVAEALLKVIEKRKSVSIMGGTATVLFAKLNSIAPKLADCIVMKGYGKILKSFLYAEKENSIEVAIEKKNKLLNNVAAILVILSFLLYGLIFVVPFLPLNLSKKAIVISILVATGEVSWWIGIAIAGKQLVSKYRRYLNPCKLLSCRKNNLLKEK